MPNIAQRSKPGRAVDTDAKLKAAQIDAIRTAGYSCVIRYVPLPGISAATDIDAAELVAILGANLGVMLVQHTRFAGWNPANHSGKTDAQAAIAAAQEAQYIAGAHLFVDLEGIDGTAAATIQFANDWADAIVSAGYLAGAYVGFDVPLTPEQLYELHRINSYWSSEGPRSVATRGFAMKQGATLTIDGVEVDPNVIQLDEKNETPVWMIQQTSAANA